MSVSGVRVSLSLSKSECKWNKSECEWSKIECE